VRRIGPTVSADRSCSSVRRRWPRCSSATSAATSDELEKRFQKRVDIKSSTSIAVDQYKVEARVVKVEEPQTGKGARWRGCGRRLRSGSGRRKRSRGGRRGKGVGGGGGRAAVGGGGGRGAGDEREESDE
jgi:hypothetical protein